MKNDADEPIQAVFHFKNTIIGTINQIVCNLSPSCKDNLDDLRHCQVRQSISIFQKSRRMTKEISQIHMILSFLLFLTRQSLKFITLHLLTNFKRKLINVFRVLDTNSLFWYFCRIFHSLESLVGLQMPWLPYYKHGQ